MKLRYAVMTLLLGMFFSVPAISSNYNFPKTFYFNEAVWKLDYQDETGHSIMAEYVTGDDSIQHWKQLFTYQQLKRALPENVSPRNFADHVDAGLKGKGLDYTFKVLSSTSDEAVLEFRIRKPETAQQDELQRVIKTRKGIFVVMHYVVKGSDMGDKARQKWIKNLNSVPIMIL